MHISQSPANILKQSLKRGLKNLHVWLKGLRRMGEEEDVEEGESIDPHGGGGGLVCQGEDNTWRRKEWAGRRENEAVE